MKIKNILIRLPRQILIALILIGAIEILYPYITNAVIPCQKTSITIEFESSEIISELGSDQDMIIFYTFIVICNMSNADEKVREIIVELSVSAGQNWDVDVDPLKVIFHESGSERVNITIIVPAGTSYYSSRSLSIGGTVTFNPGSITYNIPPMTGTIIVNQYYSFSINCQDPTQEIESGTKATYNLEIYNRGNARDKFEINITNHEELKAKGFKLELNPDSLEIPETENATVELNITAPIRGGINENHEIQLNIFSVQAKLNDNETIEENLTLIAYLTSNCVKDHDGFFGSLGFNELDEINNVDFAISFFSLIITIILILGLNKLIKAPSHKKK